MPRKIRGKTTSQIVHAARDLRQTATHAEEILWEALRGRRLSGLKFRRQHPVGRFVLDMFCVEHQLAVEIDGIVHQTPHQIEYDTERAKFLTENGIRVLRFKNDEVEYHLDEVLKKIIASASTPSPDDVLPSGEGAGG